MEMPQLPPLDIQHTAGDSAQPFADSFDAVFHDIQLAQSPSRALRKSLSVDSLAVSPPRTLKEPQHPPSRGFVAGLTSAFRREANSDLRSTRNRGASISSIHDKQPQVELDVDRHPLPGRDHRFRRPSLRGADHSKPTVRGGELPLPARTSSSAHDLPTLPTPTNIPPDQAVPAQNLAPRHIVNAPANSGRTHSMSNGIQSQQPHKRMAVNTQFATVPPPPTMNENVTLIVIGSPGCGKTQAIRRGLSGFNLSEALPSTVQRLLGDTSAPIYTYRLGTIVRDKIPDCPLTVIEIDVAVTGNHIPRDHLWPQAVPSIDGAVICYNSADRSSFVPMEHLLRAYHAMRLPIIVLACKADLDPQVEPEYASSLLQQYRAGLVEVSVHSDVGRDKLKRSFDWLLKAVFRHRKAIDTINKPDNTYLNPASPDVLVSPSLPWEGSRTATPTAAQQLPPSSPSHHRFQSQSHHAHVPEKLTVGTNCLTTSASVQSEVCQAPENHSAQAPSSLTGESIISGDELANPTPPGNEQEDDTTDRVPRAPRQPSGKEKDKPKPAQFATLDTLLDKLLFIAVSGDDPSFISSFLLTYRRFCTPRKVLLAMQKKMRHLDEPSGDPVFSCFAQMRICHLLEIWIADYPNDFAVKGTASALHALIRSILAKTHLLHYGSQLLPFLEILPILEDQDAVWAIKPETTEESDGESLMDEEDYIKPYNDKPDPPSIPSSSPSETQAAIHRHTRERKASLPLARNLGLVTNGPTEHLDPTSTKQQLKELHRIANEVMAIDASEIAEEITRVEAKYFLNITNRDWMHFVFLKQKKTDDPIVAFNTVANHIGDWVVSLILCHDKPLKRARQMEKMVDIAARLRMLNNYSALRAFVAGINSATYPGDETMELFKSRSPEQAKNLQSWEVLLQQLRAHRAYRLALRNSKGFCIPAMEVHIADMIKAQENNKDCKEDDPSKIHWAKFSMMGRFVSITTQCQNQCRSSTDYHFPDRRHVRDLFIKRNVMSLELQRARLKDPELGDYGLLPNQQLPKQEAQAMRRLFFW